MIPNESNSKLHHRRKIFIFVLALILFLTAFLHLGGLLTDIRKGISDWHLDSARYLVQGRQYVRGNFKPIGHTPWYTGNPYANILFLSFVWKGLNKTAKWMEYGSIPLTNLNFSLCSRFAYLFLVLLLGIILYRFAIHVFNSHSIGLFTALLWALSPLSINLNHIIKPEIPLTFFVTLAAIAAYFISEKDHVVFYILGGIAAGIATALKYNGAIVLVYLFFMHGYRTFKKENGIFKNLFHTIFSLKLVLTGIFWTLSFYACEPVFWLGIPKAVHHIRQYLHTAAYTATPPELKAHGGIISFLAYSLKTIPHNLSIFVRSVHPVVLILAFVALFLPEKRERSKIYRIVSLPALIMLILFATKPLIGAEFLLHVVPFVFVLAAYGLRKILGLFNKIPTKAFTLLLQTCLILLIVTPLLYACLFEIKFFSIGNIRFYANVWAMRNLPGQCIKSTTTHTIPSRKQVCKEHPPAVFVRYTKTEFSQDTKDIPIKTFNLERKKPLIHLIKAYKLQFYGSQGRYFDGPPLVPAIPVPKFPSTTKNFVRFMNGVDFDPGYYTFFLRPGNEYHWTLISETPIHTLPCLFINSYHINKPKFSTMKEIRPFLPYERRIVEMKLKPDFPWQSPYIYSFNLYPNDYMTLLIGGSKNYGSLIKKTATGKEKLSDNPEFSSKEKPDSQEILLPCLNPLNKVTFKKLFRKIHHYDYNLLQPLLNKIIPLSSFHRIDPTLFVPDMANSGTSCLVTKHPMYLGKGNYILFAKGFISTGENLTAVLGLKTYGKILCYKEIHPPSDCQANSFDINIPFKTDTETFVYPFAIFNEKVTFQLSHLSILTDFTRMFREKVLENFISRRLQGYTEDSPFLDLVTKADPFLFNDSLRFKTGRWLYERGFYELSEKWLLSFTRDEPLNHEALILFHKVKLKLGKKREAGEIQQRLLEINQIHMGPWEFETGYKLEGFVLPEQDFHNGGIKVILYLRLQDFNGDQSAFISFEKDGNLYFAKDFSLLNAKPFGNLYTIKGVVQTPKNIPTGKYDVYFTFRIPKEGYKYHVIGKENKPLRSKAYLTTVEIK